ncbi:unnamed protein product, partial [marine sediment metagenome]
SASRFSVYLVTLSRERFRGLPTEWHFAILDPAAQFTDEQVEKAVLPEAHGILAETPPGMPLLLISAALNVRLGEEFLGGKRQVFCIDSDALRGKKRIAARVSPFALAIRRKLPSAPDVALLLSPYQRERPVSGWQFYGRDAELAQLVSSSDNLIIVGGRRIGKTSLMLEAKRRMEKAGDGVLYVNVQSFTTSGEVISAILSELDPRTKASAIRRSMGMGESVLSVALRRLAGRGKRITLMLDELGNLIKALDSEDWGFLGLLRTYAQKGNLRVVFSSFQEIFRAQEEAFAGPLVNFGHVMRVGVFSRHE